MTNLNDTYIIERAFKSFEMRRVNILTSLFHPNFNPYLEKFKIFVPWDLTYFKEFIFSLTPMTCCLPIHCLVLFCSFCQNWRKNRFNFFSQFIPQIQLQIHCVHFSSLYFSDIAPMAYLKGSVVIVFTIVLKFLKKSISFFLEAIVQVDDNTFFFQQQFKLGYNLLSSLVHGSLLPKIEHCKTQQINQFEDSIS